MTNSYDIGDLVDLTGTFTNPDTGADVDPTAVTCSIRKPDGTTATAATSKVSTGVYAATVTPDQAGTWWYAFDGTGAAQASEELCFFVRARRVAR